MVHQMEERAKKAGMSRDSDGAEALAQLLQWLRRWRKKDFERAEDDRYAGGQVWRWAEAWWQEQLEESEDDRHAGGRRKKVQDVMDAVAAKTVKMSRVVTPFCGEVKERVEEWLEDHMAGDKPLPRRRPMAACGRSGKHGAAAKDGSHLS